ncbi:cyclin-D1-binding protein 1 homolog isoform X2 [Acanthaster planci]|uniref:Cyclin-D1-binding protein 1 homolog isoform X2 n=1 Tax=Acanthaster planci TaxID=133434 RepID=A0A8B7YH74_ACAPL|nr:cyclin-D1-binding protein 1 homolog isoform X2 [Acanthaster planci]
MQRRTEEDSPRPTAPDHSLEEFWKKLGAAFESLSAEATKLALWFSKPPLPKPEECQSLIASVEMSTIALVSVFYGLPKEHGLMLRRATRHTVMGAVEGIRNLAKRIKQDHYHSSDSQLHATGNVWERCDAFKTLPRNNKDALLSAVSNVRGLVNDAVDELKELQETGGGPEGWDDLGLIAGAPSGDTNMQEGWSEHDRMLLPPCSGLLKASASCVKKVSGAVQAHGQWKENWLVAQLDDLGEIAERISPAADDLVMCLYAPIRQQDVRQNANKLAEVLLSLLDQTKTSHVVKEADNSWLTFLSKAVDHNLEKITQLTAPASPHNDR